MRIGRVADSAYSRSFAKTENQPRLQAWEGETGTYFGLGIPPSKTMPTTRPTHVRSLGSRGSDKVRKTHLAATPGFGT